MLRKCFALAQKKRAKMLDDFFEEISWEGLENLVGCYGAKRLTGYRGGKERVDIRIFQPIISQP